MLASILVLLSLRASHVFNCRCFAGAQYRYLIQMPVVQHDDSTIESSTGTALVAGDFVTGLAVSVTSSNIRQLLEAANFDSGGRLELIT
jgi:hypothetical protein